MIKIVWRGIQWLLGKARKDLDKLISNIKNDDLYLSYFLAQQCIEKCMKVLLSHAEIDFPKSHDLAKLWDLFTHVFRENEKIINGYGKYAALYSTLTALYQEERYGMWFDEEYDNDDIQEIVTVCEELYILTKEAIA